MTDGQPFERFAGLPDAPGCPILHLVPHNAGWVAQWRREPWTAVTIDLARPTVRDGDFWWYVDLELDLWESSAEPPALTQSTVMHATTGEVEAPRLS